MKIVGMVCVLNEEELLAEFLDHTLPLVDLLVISEGAVIGHPFSTPHGHSIDNTNEILAQYQKMYPGKIELVYNDGNKWESKQEQQNAMLDFVEEGDWCFIFGVDELYLPDTRVKLEKLVKKYPDITEFVFSIIHFWDEDNVVVNKENKDYRLMQRHQRVFKYQSYMYYHNHPTINAGDTNQDTFFNEEYKERKMYLDMPGKMTINDINKTRQGHLRWVGISNYEDNITIFHYSFIRNYTHQIMKSIYYLMRDKNLCIKDAFWYVNDSIRTLGSVYGYICQIHSTQEITTIEYTEDHPLKNKVWNKDYNPEIIKQYIKDFSEIPTK